MGVLKSTTLQSVVSAGDRKKKIKMSGVSLIAGHMLRLLEIDRTVFFAGAQVREGQTERKPCGLPGEWTWTFPSGGHRNAKLDTARHHWRRFLSDCGRRFFLRDPSEPRMQGLLWFQRCFFTTKSVRRCFLFMLVGESNFGEIHAKLWMK